MFNLYLKSCEIAVANSPIFQITLFDLSPDTHKHTHTLCGVNLREWWHWNVQEGIPLDVCLT